MPLINCEINLILTWSKDCVTENVLRLEIAEVVLVHCNIVNNIYQQNSRVLCTFVPNKSFGQLLNILPEIFVIKKHLIQNFHILMYGLQIKILNSQTYICKMLWTFIFC